jgi:hypothetical protein
MLLHTCHSLCRKLEWQRRHRLAIGITVEICTLARSVDGPEDFKSLERTFDPGQARMLLLAPLILSFRLIADGDHNIVSTSVWPNLSE